MLGRNLVVGVTIDLPVRRLRALLPLLLVALGLAHCGPPARDGAAPQRRVLVIGIDGMDPQLLRRYMDAGDLPHLSRLARTGGWKPLATSMPPQSPVAWSNVIAGGGPGSHEIYDFIHRDPHPAEPALSIRPYLSTATTEPPAVTRQVGMGDWRLDLASPTTTLRRQGPTFWSHLVEAGIETTIYRMPANYPVLDVPGARGHRCFQCLSGMGTPDLLGNYGTFTVYTPDAPIQGQTVPGGRFEFFWTEDHRGNGKITGPPNPYRKDGAELTVPFTAVRDPQRDLVRIEVADDLVLLQEGEWSKWIQLRFKTGLRDVPAMVRFFVRQVHPDLELFMTPINIDPTDPVEPISVPTEFARRIAEATGLYDTIGIPQHAPEVQRGGLDASQWLEKTRMILDQRIRQFDHALGGFEAGCLFFYFGAVDLVSHIYWRDQDPDHPAHDPEAARQFGDVIADTYRRMDGVVGKALDAMRAEDVLIVLSDHGFTSFRRQFNLNTWLKDEGYLSLKNPSLASNKVFANYDWTETRAYGVGLNGLYLNLAGRERDGIVSPAERDALKQQITEKLLAVRDTDGAQVIARVYDVAAFYPGADAAIAPDLLIGYARHYRASWATLLGDTSKHVLEDNFDRWSGDHCIAAHLVPGVLLANRPITADAPALVDIGPTILELFGRGASADMKGKSVLGE
ncbi:MAG: sulfatase arylsulfatase [Phycisphaeraceae bacterium]|nr:sulfatase arylsulfatase [Phycisphaeraceae bacterium]